MQPLSGVTHSIPVREVLAIPMNLGGMMFQFVGMIFDSFAFIGKTAKALKSRDWKLIDHGSKAMTKLGSVISKVGVAVDRVRGLLPSASSASSAIRVAGPVLVAVGGALSGLALFNDLRNAYKIRQFQKQLRAVRLNWQSAACQSSPLYKNEVFKELVQLIDRTRPGIVRKSFGVKKDELQGLVKTMYCKSHDDAEITSLFQKLDKKTTSQLRLQMFNAMMDVVGLVSGILLIIPVMQPAGLALAAVTLLGTAYNMYHEINEGYKFANDIGLINSRYGKSLKMKEYILDKFGLGRVFLDKELQPAKEKAQPIFAAKPAYRPIHSRKPVRVRYA